MIEPSTRQGTPENERSVSKEPDVQQKGKEKKEEIKSASGHIQRVGIRRTCDDLKAKASPQPIYLQLPLWSRGHAVSLPAPPLFLLHLAHQTAGSSATGDPPPLRSGAMEPGRPIIGGRNKEAGAKRLELACLRRSATSCG